MALDKAVQGWGVELKSSQQIRSEKTKSVFFFQRDFILCILAFMAGCFDFGTDGASQSQSSHRDPVMQAIAVQGEGPRTAAFQCDGGNFLCVVEGGRKEGLGSGGTGGFSVDGHIYNRDVFVRHRYA